MKKKRKNKWIFISLKVVSIVFSVPSLSPPYIMLICVIFKKKNLLWNVNSLNFDENVSSDVTQLKNQ